MGEGRVLRAKSIERGFERGDADSDFAMLEYETVPPVEGGQKAVAVEEGKRLSVEEGKRLSVYGTHTMRVSRRGGERTGL